MSIAEPELRSGLPSAREVLPTPPSALPPRTAPRGQAPLLAPVLMLVSDLFASHLGFYAAWHARYVVQLGGDVEPEDYVDYARYFPVALVLSAILVGIFYLGSLYRRQQPSFFFNDWANVAVRNGAGVMAVSWTVLLIRYPANSRLTFLYVWLFVTTLIVLGRLLVQLVTGALHRRGVAVERVLVVGEDSLGQMVMQSLTAQPHLGFQVAGFLANDRDSDFGRFHYLGPVDVIDQVCQEERIDQVIVALPTASHALLLKIVDHCRQAGVRFKIVPDLFEMSISRVDLDTMSGIPLIDLKEVSIDGWSMVQKRGLDIVVATVALAIFAVPMALIALAIKLTSPGPVVFRQTRVGRDGKHFTMYKFRSMKESADEERETLLELNEASGPLFKIQRDPRMTAVGRVLRKFSLDELPQLVNVLRGQMSLVGPRPALPVEAERYEDWHRKRLQAPPGMTGLWQVSGRSELTFEEMIVFDVTYIQNWSLGLDVSILMRTLPAVISGGGAF